MTRLRRLLSLVVLITAFSIVAAACHKQVPPQAPLPPPPPPTPAARAAAAATAASAPSSTRTELPRRSARRKSSRGSRWIR